MAKVMEEVIAFTRGVPPVESFPVKKIEECARAALEKDAGCVLQYGTAAGYTPLRNWIAEEYQVSADQVLIGQGSLQLLDTLTRVSFKAEDYVFLEQPTYDRVLTIFRRSGVKLAGIDLHEGLLDFEQLEAKLKAGIIPRYFYLIPDFQNPSGAVMPLEDRHRLVKLARHYRFFLIEDGPYRHLRYYGESLPTLFELAPKQVIHTSSFSKLISPGLRVGFMILPMELFPRVRKFAEDTYINASYLNQAIAKEFIERGWLAQNLVELKELYRPRLDTLLQTLEEQFNGIASWIQPQGGFFVGMNLNEGYQVPDKEKTLAGGLVLSDSHGFFIEGGDQFIRLPFCALNSAQIQEGITRLRKLFPSG
jgi:2-aminoadipate transaminase